MIALFKRVELKMDNCKFTNVIDCSGCSMYSDCWIVRYAKRFPIAECPCIYCLVKAMCSEKPCQKKKEFINNNFDIYQDGKDHGAEIISKIVVIPKGVRVKDYDYDVGSLWIGKD